MKHLLPILLLVTGLSLAGCDATSTAPEPEVVVESYQVAGEPLAPVRLTRSVDLDATYSPTATAIQGATVVIERLDENEAVVARYAYVPDVDEPGRYLPTTSSVTVAPNTTYRLVAEVPDDGRVSATTRVPGAIEIVRAANDTAVFQSDDQPSLTVTRSNDSSSRQDRYVFTVTSLLDFEAMSEEELAAELTPFYVDLWEDGDAPVSDVRVNPSPILNEANYDVNDDGTVTIDLPWIAVAFFGPNRVAVNVIDDNYYDFLRSQQAQQSGTPGEIPNVLDRVEGGTGLFASYASVAHDVEILRP